MDSMHKPLVSVCCMTYNHENYIRQCLDGFVMQQTNFAFEILVHEDASTDSTASIVREFEAKHPHLFRCVYQTKNQFAIQNTLINILFPMSRGKYIALCEGDDYWIDPLKLQKQVDFLEGNKDFSGIHSNVLYVDRNDASLGESNRVCDKIINRGYETFEDLVIQNSITTCSFLFRSSSLLYKKRFLWEFSSDFNDIYFFLKVALEGKIKYLSEFTAAYRRNVGIMKTYTKFDLMHENNDTLLFFLKLELTSNQKAVCYQRIIRNYVTIFYMNALTNTKLAYFSLFSILKYALIYLSSNPFNAMKLISEFYEKKLIKGLIYMNLPIRLRKRPYKDWFGVDRLYSFKEYFKW